MQSKQEKKALSLSANEKFKKTILGENGEFTLGISQKKLKDIIANKTRTLDFSPPAAAYDQLSPANKRALAHLVKAATFLDTIFLKQDHPDNIRAKEVLEKAAADDNKRAEQALTLFTIFNGIEGNDMYAKKTKPLRIFKDKKLQPGKGFYPKDITKKELVKYILAHPEQASAIFSNNTMVQRDGNRLVTIPYSVAFRSEMEDTARELLAAAGETDHKGLADYLRWQAQALVNDSDPEMVFNADKSWVDLEDSPLEFTISRETYSDYLSGDVASHPKVEALLKANSIKAKAKDSIGVRVGIVNKDSHSEIADYRKHLKAFSLEMPLRDQYEDQSDDAEENRTTFADVDLVALTGDFAAIREMVTTAQNLPNDDKLLVQLGMGNRMVFHRQVRQSVDPEQRQKFLEALIEPSQHQWHNENAYFLFVIGHELGHSRGPKTTKDGRDKKTALGKLSDMLDENKADVTSIDMTDYFVKIGKFTQTQANEIYMTWTASELPAKQPSDKEAHNSRLIMQLNYFIEKGAVLFEKGGKLSIVPEKMADTARQMMNEVIQLQLDGNIADAEAFVKKYAAWNDTLQYAADEKMKLKPKLYSVIKQPLKDTLSHKI